MFNPFIRFVFLMSLIITICSTQTIAQNFNYQVIGVVPFSGKMDTKATRKSSLKEITGFIKLQISKQQTDSRAWKALRKAITDDCFVLHLRSGEVLDVQVLKITPTQIVYKRCGYPNDPEITTNKKDVVRLKDAQGVVMFDGLKDNSGDLTDVDRQKLQKLAMLAGILGIAGFLGLLLIPFLGLPLGIAALGLGIISHKRYKAANITAGKTWALLGIVLGSVIIGLTLLGILLILLFWI